MFHLYPTLFLVGSKLLPCLNGGNHQNMNVPQAVFPIIELTY